MTKKSILNACILEEVLIEILARLLVKSLLQFRSICKSWYSLITNPSFITTHLNRTKSNHANKLLIKFKSENRDRCLSFTDDKTFGDEFVNFEYPFQNYNEFFKIVGACDRLLCLSDYYGLDYAVLWNPSIRRFVTLLEFGSSVIEDCCLLWFDFGFGFNSMSNDYNVKLHVPLMIIASMLCIGWSFLCLAHVLGDPFVLDCVCILAFDIVDEVFREISLPNHQIDVNVRTNTYITVLRESLAVIIYEDDFASMKMIRTNHVWVMEEYGVIESWTKRCRIIGKQLLLTIVGSRKNGDVLRVQDVQTGLRELVQIRCLAITILVDSDRSFWYDGRPRLGSDHLTLWLIVVDRDRGSSGSPPYKRWSRYVSWTTLVNFSI
ncbi:uncharacterized protein LOC114258801 [Camellia sinensis]|uniref:uncharacterized protein LOC114258801 n=1 Tax=Camellia sinensis TaxID=4442 RepID=UPI001035B4D7|nr:uncharacterized protein LOC114258801 [Camellia sinensis]